MVRSEPTTFIVGIAPFLELSEADDGPKAATARHAEEALIQLARLLGRQAARADAATARYSDQPGEQ